MNWVENLNSIVCLVLLGCLLPVAAIANKIWHKASVMLMTLAVGLQLFAPWVGWIPEMGWPSAFLNASLLLFVGVYKDDLWHLARVKFSPGDLPRRRASDAA